MWYTKCVAILKTKQVLIDVVDGGGSDREFPIWVVLVGGDSNWSRGRKYMAKD